MCCDFDNPYLAIMANGVLLVVVKNNSSNVMEKMLLISHLVQRFKASISYNKQVR